MTQHATRTKQQKFHFETGFLSLFQFRSFVIRKKEETRVLLKEHLCI